MESFLSRNGKHIKILKFTEEQMAKVGAALQALANEILPSSKDATDQKYNDVTLLCDPDQEEANNKQNYYDNIYSVCGIGTEAQLLDGRNQSLCKNSNLGAGTYITLSDITADQIEVREISTNNAFTDIINQGRDRLNTWSYDCLSLEGNESQHIECVVPVKELMKETYLELPIEGHHIQTFPQTEEALTGPNTKLTEEHISTFIGSVSTNMMNCPSDDSDVEFSDSKPEQTINLIDSEFEEDLEQDGLVKSQNTNQIDVSNNFNNPTWMDCYLSYSCPECGANCGNLSAWKLHTNTVHSFGTLEALNMKTILDKTGSICFQCRDCTKKFGATRTSSKLQIHRISHMTYKSYVHCRLCNLSFAQNSGARRHIRNCHWDKTPEFSQTQEQPNCMKYVRIACPVCNKQFDDKKQWQTHLQIIHDFINRSMAEVAVIPFDVYVCRKCQVELRKTSILNHMTMHEKYKPFSCTYCNNYESYRLSSVMLHVERVHMDKMKRVYKCEFCEAVFYADRPRRTHMRRCHRIQCSKCAVCKKKFLSIASLLSHMNFANHHQLK